MSKVTRREVNELKNSLKEAYNEVFEVKRYEDLSRKAKRVYDKYCFNDATAIYEGEAYNKLTADEQIIYDGVKSLLEGKAANPINTKKALEVYKGAYELHKNHEKPAWYHFFDRYAYWKESKTVEAFANKLVAKGVSVNKIEAAKAEVDSMYDYTRSNAMDNDVEVIGVERSIVQNIVIDEEATYYGDTTYEEFDLSKENINDNALDNDNSILMNLLSANQ